MGERRDRRCVAAALLAAAIALGQAGCAPSCAAAPSAAEFPRTGDMPSEGELEVARSIGCSEEYVERIGREGLDLWGAQYLGTADAVRRRLEEKYGMGFEVADVGGPELMDTQWYVTLRVSSGEHEGTEVEATLPARAGTDELADDLVPRLREGELVAYAGEVVEEVYSDSGLDGTVFAYVVPQQYGNTVTLENDISEIAGVLDTFIRVYIAPWKSVSKEEYEALAERLDEELHAKRIRCQWSVCHILTDTTPDGAVTVQPDDFSPSFGGLVVSQGVEGVDWEWRIWGNTYDLTDGYIDSASKEVADGS